MVAAGGRPRSETEDRIEFLAHARNMAIEPVFPEAPPDEAVDFRRNVSARLLVAEEGAAGGAGAGGAGAGGAAGAASVDAHAGGAAAAGWTPDRIVFPNDVFFCVRDVVRAPPPRALPSAALGLNSVRRLQQGRHRPCTHLRPRLRRAHYGTLPYPTPTPSARRQVRLLAHEGDLVCGMDFHVDVREGWDRHWRNIPAVDIHPWGPHGPPLGVRARARGARPACRHPAGGQPRSCAGTNALPSLPCSLSASASSLWYDRVNEWAGRYAPPSWPWEPAACCVYAVRVIMKRLDPHAPSTSSPVPGPGGQESLTLPCGGARAQVMHKRHDHMIFYDCWVARDAGGLPFANNRPFVAHQYSRLRLEAGQPFPVSCCWNGMALINAAPFRKGIRFRRAWGAKHPRRCCGACEQGGSGGRCDPLPGRSLRVSAQEWFAASEQRS